MLDRKIDCTLEIFENRFHDAVLAPDILVSSVCLLHTAQLIFQLPVVAGSLPKAPGNNGTDKKS
jgi:hypothetical protein